MAQVQKFQDLEETGEALVAFITSSQLEKLRQVKEDHQALFESHVGTRTLVTQVLKGRLRDKVQPYSIGLLAFPRLYFIMVRFGSE